MKRDTKITVFGTIAATLVLVLTEHLLGFHTTLYFALAAIFVELIIVEAGM